MKNLTKIRALGIMVLLLVVIGDTFLFIYIKDFFEFSVVLWVFDLTVMGFYFNAEFSERKAKHDKNKRDKYKEWADKLNRGEKL